MYCKTTKLFVLKLKVIFYFLGVHLCFQKNYNYSLKTIFLIVEKKNEEATLSLRPPYERSVFLSHLDVIRISISFGIQMGLSPIVKCF